MVREHDLMEFLLTSNTLLDKSTDYRYLSEWLGTGLLLSSGSKWKKRRRIITPAFHFAILEQFIEVFEYNGNKLIEKLHREVDERKSIDIYQYVTDCTLDIISETAMNVSINTQDNKNQDYVFAVKEVCRVAVLRSLSAWKRFDLLFRLFSDDYGKMKQYLKTLHNFTNSVIDQRLNELAFKKTEQNEDKENIGIKPKKAFLNLLLNASIDGKPLTREDIREEVDTFMFENRVRDEQKRIYGHNKNDPTTYTKLQDMKYLELVIKEALRLYPPVPMVARNAPEDIDYKGQIIPKGTIITLSIYGINRDPDYHESPEELNPDRFVDNENRPFSYIPFSAGPRNCIGQKFAILEMKSMISKLIRNFELNPTDPPHKPQFVSDVVLKSQNGIKIMLKKHVW